MQVQCLILEIQHNYKREKMETPPRGVSDEVTVKLRPEGRDKGSIPGKEDASM